MKTYSTRSVALALLTTSLGAAACDPGIAGDASGSVTAEMIADATPMEGGLSAGEENSTSSGGPDDLPSRDDMDRRIDVEEKAYERVRRIESQMTAMEREDVAFVASSRGWTRDEATLKLGWQPRFAELLEELRAAYPEDYAGAAALQDGHEFQAFIAFRADVPESVAHDPRLRGIKIDLRGHQGYSEQQRARRAREVHRALRNAGFLKIATAPDVESGIIDVQLAPHEKHTHHSATMRMLPDEARAADVRIHLVDDLPTEYEAVYGGARTSDCTAAFAVKSGLVTGMATAGHCGNTQYFRNHTNASVWSTFQSEHEGSWGDFQWHTLAGDTPTHFFYSNASKTPREAWAVGSAFTGQTLCHFGKTTGYKCDEVRKVNISVVGHDDVVSMKNGVTESGDSGGPWFYGNTLYGVHTGTHWWFGKRSYFSQAKFLDEALGVTPLLCEYRKSCTEWECGNVKVECGKTLNCGACNGPCEGGVCTDGTCCSTNDICSDGGYCALLNDIP